MSILSPIAQQFVAGWPKQRRFWDDLTQTAHNICKEGLRDGKKLKCQITYRTKDKQSLEAKLQNREKEKGDYNQEEEILADIIDLAGIRILLPFPDDVQEVKDFLLQEFGEKSIRTRYKGLDGNGRAVERSDNRFLGYRATHFLVTWKHPSGYNCEIKTDDEHVGKTVEVQVTTLLMNGWQEAGHDITYKELSGNPSEDERSMLELVNGLAHSGEVALRQLQIIQNRRINEQSRLFQDKHELTIWLKEWLKRWKDEHHQSNQEVRFRLGYVELLWVIIQIKGLKTPHELAAALRYDNTNSRNPESSPGSQNDAASSAHEYLPIIVEDSLGNLDLSLWAIIRICVPFDQKESIPELDAKMKGFAVIYAINLALCRPHTARFMVQEYLAQLKTFDVDDESKARMKGALFSVLYSNTSAEDQKEYVNEVSHILSNSFAWRGLLQASTALLHSRLLIIPEPTFQCLMEGSSAIIWPLEIDEQEFSAWKASKSRCDASVVITPSLGSLSYISSSIASNYKWLVIEMVNLNFVQKGDTINLKDVKRHVTMDDGEGLVRL
ncbi:MAG: hypothetical protein M1820_002575 [Bogoriella megaspora]|nr:MAG: hypothetical protein M1820_002575 [Bogoriella megaspora]